MNSNDAASATSTPPLDEGETGLRPRRDFIGEPTHSDLRRPLWCFGAKQWLAVAVAAVMALVLFVIPVPYVVDRPGPTFNIIGSANGRPFISISGTDPATGKEVATDRGGASAGELRMVTVSQSGGPGSRLSLIELIGASFDSRNRIVAYDEVYPEDLTKDALDEATKTQMSSSQSTSEVAALEYLGWTVGATMTIAGAVEGSGAAGKVEEGDVIESITTADGVVHPVDAASTVFGLLRETPVGTTLVLSIIRDSERLDIPVVTSSGAEGEQGSKLGIYLNANVSLPLDISFNLEDVGGPSAGMMFALGIIDTLTEGDLTGGRIIAGTGTLSYDGQVGAIGGIVQKMWGASRDGAEWFLAPESNCGEVVGNVPQGLTVVSVATLDDAVGAVTAIAEGRGDSLATCDAQG